MRTALLLKELMPKDRLSIAEQLRHLENFMDGGQLYLVRCYNCWDTGRENWACAVASGICAWCGWDPDDEPKEGDDISILRGATLDSACELPSTPPTQ